MKNSREEESPLAGQIISRKPMSTQSNNPISILGLLGKKAGFILLSIWALISLSPVLWVFDGSFRPPTEIFNAPPFWFSAPWAEKFAHYSLDSFFRAVNEFSIDQAFLNSCIVTFGTVFLTIIVCSLSAYAFSYLKFRGSQFLFYTTLATMMIPTITMLPASYKVIQQLGMFNNYFALILPASASGMGVFLLRQFMLRIPLSLREAALVDGAGHLRIWATIILPLARPAIAALAIYQFLASWNAFLQPMMFLTRDSMWTIPVRLQGMMGTNFNPPYGPMVAISLIAAAVPIFFFVAFQKQFIEGLTGSVKG